MAITTAMCTSFKQALLDGEMDFSSDTSQVFKLALYTSSASLGPATTAYSATDEISGGDYVAGGATLTISTNPTTNGTTAYLSFSSVVWGSLTATIRGALVYKADGATNPAVVVLDFGEAIAISGGSFTVNFPLAAASTAVVRLL